MSDPIKYVIITPVRDEEPYIEKTLESVASQTIRPTEWIIVNDGSVDKTGEILDRYTDGQAWIKTIHRSNRGFRKSGGGVIEAFYDGYASLGVKEFDFLVKLDGDLSFDADYFKNCFKHFKSEPNLGIGGGMICILKDGRIEEDAIGDPPFHVRGATKIYRRACWDRISPLERAPGWDTVDEVKANMLGWTTRTFRDLSLLQLKPTGRADGNWRNWIKNGRANYVTGYHPAFMLAKCIKRTFSRPPFLESAALWYGFISGYLSDIPQVEDKNAIQYLRKEQVRRLTLRPSIYR
jgi:glycosyltransferase involved in cell wall biosynthesis